VVDEGAMAERVAEEIEAGGVPEETRRVAGEVVWRVVEGVVRCKAKKAPSGTKRKKKSVRQSRPPLTQRSCPKKKSLGKTKATISAQAGLGRLDG
jgi:hypothetical protein